MDEHEHHEHLIKGIAGQYEEILENSKQGIYIYLDDTHKVCNRKFSDMLGFESPEVWAKNESPFIESFVAKDSAQTLVSTYAQAMQDMVGSEVKVTWMKKTGEEVESDVVLVPVTFEGHIFALHFVTPV